MTRLGFWVGTLGLAAGMGVSMALVGCSNGTNQLQPLELAFLRPSMVAVPDPLFAGTVSNYISFDLRRERDGVLITQPLTTYVQTAGADATQEPLTDDLGNLISPNRAVVLLGNGLTVDGALQPPPTPFPNISASPKAPYAPPTGWQGRATLAYVPGQTTIPNRAPDNRFGVYVASLLPFTARLVFATQDVQNVVVVTPQTLTFQSTPTQQVIVALAGITPSPQEPVIVAVCNQINAAILVGVQQGSQTALQVPVTNPDPHPLDAPTAYRAEAYQFNNQAQIQRISVNPTDPERLDVPLEGTATLELTPVTNPDSQLNQATCFGDKLRDVASVAPGLLVPRT